jgi:proton-translocating NADH-quinone oxidoreductase chain N
MDSVVLKSFIPEIFLSLCILFQLFLNAVLINNITYNYPIINKEIFFQTLFLLFCLTLLFFNNKMEGFFFNFLLINDFSSKILKILLSIICILLLLPVLRSFISQNLNFFEYFIIFLISVLSTLLIISASDMLSVYLLIELQTLCFYVLASFRKNSSFSIEAGLKYFIFGSFISGIFLLGCSILFACLGTLNFNNLFLLLSIPFSLELQSENKFLLVGVLLITIVFLFKVAAIPFHFWVPDVYEGSPLGSTIIFSILPKLSIFYLFFKWLVIINNFSEIKILLLISGLLSVFFGSFLAISQKRLKRFIIYSSISQIGFLTTALSSTNLNSFVSIYFFLFIYIITSLIIWLNISLFFNFQSKVNFFYKKISVSPLFLSNFSALFKFNKIWSLSFILIFFSLSGIPPLVGFLSKILILFSLFESKNFISSFLLLLVSAISVFYYLRIIKIVFFEDKNNLKINSSQIITSDYFFEIDCLLIAFLLFLLLFLFFYPTLFIYFFFVMSDSFFF